MGTDSVIYFRTDGNLAIATGHIMRCLSIARACFTVAGKAGSRRPSVCFLVSDQESASMLHRFLEPGENISVQILENADYQNLELEIPALIAALKKSVFFVSSDSISTSKPILFLDSYFVTPDYLEALAPYAAIAYLDDLQLFDYPVDLVINYDVLTPKTQKEYEKKYSLAKKRLLGAAYTPLREQFSPTSSAVKHIASRITLSTDTYHIFIASGGSDPYHTCLHLLEFFADCRNELLSAPPSCKLSFQVVIGSFNQDKEALRALAARSACITLHESITDMAALMSSCDLAFSAAGTTLYELCALGIPTASFILADNQIASAKAFEEAGAVSLLGDVRVNEEKVFSAACDFLKSMLYAPGDNGFLLRQKTAAQMQQLVDGLGAIRIAKELKFISL